MASLGHVIIGIAASRLEPADAPRLRHRRFFAATGWALLSLLPDADVAGFAMGVRYEDPWGHRGATHSFAFALAVATVVALIAPRSGRSRLRTGIMAAIVLASHPLLDTLTDGGLGCALFWPFSLTRYFAPWQPIPVAPIGLAFFSADGLLCSAVEIALFAPLLWLAFEYQRHAIVRDDSRWPRLRVTLALISLAVLWSVSAVPAGRDNVLGFVMREDTVFAANFSERRFATIVPGDTLEKVPDALGPPLRELFFYAPSARPGCYTVHVENGAIVNALDRAACRDRGVAVGDRSDGPPERLGPPTARCAAYSWSPGKRLTRARGICFEHGKVTDIVRQWMREDP